MLIITANPFLTKGQWYKGNLHTHTTNSDGRLSLEQIIDSYKEKGYNFLGITDHGKITPIDGHSTSNFLLIKGIEIDYGRSEIGATPHALVVGLKETIELPEEASMQEAINFAQSRQGTVLLGHPYWSGLTLNDILPLTGILGIEVFNTGCHRSIGKGFSTVHWDDLLAYGKNLYGFAVDDTHFPEDIGQGWIMVKAETLSVESILRSIKEGQFYSSCGPLIEKIIFQDNTITVTCSKVATINFICDGCQGTSFRSQDGGFLTRASYDLSGEERYLRVEVIDAQGSVAWSQPLFCQNPRDRV